MRGLKVVRILQQLTNQSAVKSSVSGARMDFKKAAGIEILSGWKEIANYLRKGVRTVQRYERELGLPIRRPSRKHAGSVIATKAELDAWISASPIRHSFPVRQEECHTSSLDQRQRKVLEMRRLCSEIAEARAELGESLARLRQNVRLVIPGTIADKAQADEEMISASENRRRVMADVLRFDPKRKKAN